MTESKKTTTEKSVHDKTSGRVRVSKHTLIQKLNSTRASNKSHSKRYEALAEQVNFEPLVLAEAVAKVKQTATTKFDASVELHIHLNAKKGKKGSDDELARGVVNLPHGLGKLRTVIILDEDKIATLEKTQTVDFDIAIATPSLMAKLGKVAKLLGTKGKMPNPKAGTVTDKPEEIKAAFEAGRVEWRQDAGKNVHQMIGKVSWDDQKLIENATAVLKGFTANRIASISLTSSMGPSVRVQLPK